VLKSDLPYNRICFTFAKGFKGAVARNRSRRLGREAYRLMKSRLSGGSDLILLIYQEVKDKVFLSDRLAQLESLFKKAGLFL